MPTQDDGFTQDVTAQHVAAKPADDGFTQDVTAQHVPQQGLIGDYRNDPRSMAISQRVRGDLDKIDPTQYFTLPGKPVADLGIKGIKGGLARIGIGAGFGGLAGASKEPTGDETRLGNAASGAETGGGVAAGLEGAGALGKGVGGIAKFLGKWAGKMSPEEAEAYAQDAAGARAQQDQFSKDPIGFQKNIRDKVASRLDDIQKTQTDPLLQQKDKAIIGKSVRVRPDQFEDTAAGKQITDAYNKNPLPNYKISTRLEPVPTPDRPVENWMSAENKAATQVTPEFVQGPGPLLPRTSATPDGFGGLLKTNPPRPDWAATEGELMRTKGGPSFTRTPVQSPDQAPLQTFEVPAQRPESQTLTADQALRAQRASRQAAGYNQSKNPMGYRASDDAEHMAADRLGKALEGVAPGIGKLNEGIQSNIELSNAARDAMSNPARILNTSEATGNTPMRSVHQFLGPEISNMAEQYGANQKLASLRNGTHGSLYKGLFPQARAAAADKLLPAGQALQNAGSGTSSNTLLGILQALKGITGQ